MLDIQLYSEGLTIYKGQECLGNIQFYQNPYHGHRVYLNLQLTAYPSEYAEPVFQYLMTIYPQGLQVMLPSRSQEQIDFLLAGGFRCVRKCYEVELTPSTYQSPLVAAGFQEAGRGEEAFATCAALIYQHYQETHRTINPWTAGFDTFQSLLPDWVLYERVGPAIRSLAFIDGNEIAYVWGVDMSGFKGFLTQVVSHLFQSNETICFEADDGDPWAMCLLGLCRQRPQESWDTYLLVLTLLLIGVDA